MQLEMVDLKLKTSKISWTQSCYYHFFGELHKNKVKPEQQMWLAQFEFKSHMRQ